MMPGTVHVKGYLSAKETIDKAKEKGLSVGDYLENIWNQQGDTQRVIDNMAQLEVFTKSIRAVCEIGTGCGRYLEKIIEICNLEVYESYEPDKGWAEWLACEYNIISRDCDGKSLMHTKPATVDIVHAHGVFVYLNFLTTYRYFLEIVRVVKPNGWCVFDIMTEECFDDKTVNKWLESDHNYPCFLSKAYVMQFFERRGLNLVGDFFNRYGAGKSHYMVFRNAK